MRIAVSSDSDEPVARFAANELCRRGHQVSVHGALSDVADRAWSARAGAEEVAPGDTDRAVVRCWTGTGVSIAANEVSGVRAAPCADACTADGVRCRNDADVFAIGRRSTSRPPLTEILDSWLAGTPSTDPSDPADIAHAGRGEERTR